MRRSLQLLMCFLPKKPMITSLFILSIIALTIPNLLLAQSAPTISYSPNAGIAYFTQPQNSVAPTVNDGGATVTYSLVSPPAGVTINGTTGQISWDATVAIGTYTLTVTATNTAGSAAATYSLNVIPNPDDFIKPKKNITGSTVTTVYYNADNGKYHNVDVYVPTGDVNTQRPIFMFMHGGGFQTSGVKTESYVVSFCKYMATCGFVAFAPSYNEGSGHTLPQNLAAVKDMDNCLNWIRTSATATKYGYNPNFLFVGGGSAGGHLSCNFVNYDGGSNYGGYVVNLTNVIAEADCWGSSPTADRLYSFSNLKATQIPIFLVQGSSDQTVPVQESIDLDNALTTAGAYHDFWKIAGETHGCPNHIAAISDTMAHFQNRAWKRLYPQTINPIVTPVKLISFGVAASNGVVNLNWSTTLEINTAYFSVEKSVDGKNFVSIDKVAAVGNSAVNQNYAYTDNAASLNTTNYYRLKSVDKDGTYSLSEVKSVDFSSAKLGIQGIFPNPLKSGQDLQLNYLSDKTELLTIKVLNSLGKQVLITNEKVISGKNKIFLSFGQRSKGIYYLVANKGETEVQKVPVIIE